MGFILILLKWNKAALDVDIATEFITKPYERSFIPFTVEQGGARRRYRYGALETDLRILEALFKFALKELVARVLYFTYNFWIRT